MICHPTDSSEHSCSKCKCPIRLEVKPQEETEELVCIQCAEPLAVVFVELPPDEWGCRSISKTVQEVREHNGGDWLKNGGIWHCQEYVLANQE